MEQQKMRSFGPVWSIMVKSEKYPPLLEDGTDKMCSCLAIKQLEDECPDFLHDNEVPYDYSPTIFDNFAATVIVRGHA